MVPMAGLGSRGQGFDVFKLLIAAVVAGAILLILLQTLQVLPTLGSQGPTDSAANAIKSQINNPGSVKFLDNITFNRGDSLNAKTIASQSKGLGEDQVCVMLGKNAPNVSNFKATNGKIISYNGSFAQKTRLLVLCDRQKEINGDIGNYGYKGGSGSESYFDSDISSSQCGSSFSSTGGTSTYCVVAVVAEQ